MKSNLEGFDNDDVTEEDIHENCTERIIKQFACNSVFYLFELKYSGISFVVSPGCIYSAFIFSLLAGDVGGNQLRIISQFIKSSQTDLKTRENACPPLRVKAICFNMFAILTSRKINEDRKLRDRERHFLQISWILAIFRAV